MHHAPAVSFPLARSRFLVGWLGCLALAGLATIGLWCEQQPHLGWRQGLGLLAAVATPAIALRWWMVRPTGLLRWEAGQWQACIDGVDCTGTVSIHLDLQRHLLLKLCCSAPRAGLWLWLDCGADPATWRDLRRAVYSGTHGASPSDPSSTAALQ